MLSIKARRPSWLLLLLMAFQFATNMAQDLSSANISATEAIVSPSLSPTTFQSISSTSISAQQTHTIQVGLLDHKMRPETTEAAIGDIIEFDFYPLNHSIVRAEYGFPCIPYEMTGSNKEGFFSGFHPVDKVLDSPPKYSVRVNDSEPIFFYCSAPGSCITYGMVGGINLNSSMSIDKQRTLAMDSAYMLQPGEPFPAESPLPSVNPASTVVPSSSASPSSAPSTDNSNGSGGLSKGAIAGIVVAGVCAILFGALLFFCWGRTNSLREVIERKDGTVRRVSASPNQMVEYKTPQHQVQPYHAHNGSDAGYQFRSQPAVHTGNASPGYGYQHQNTMSTGYFPANYPAKYTSPVEAHPAYHSVSSGSPPLGSVALNGHPFVHNAHDPPPRGSSAPGYYDTFPSGQAQEQLAEMEAITAVSKAADAHGSDRASKF